MARKLSIVSMLGWMVIAWSAAPGMAAERMHECHFKAVEKVYLVIYRTDKEGVEREAEWSGWLRQGQTVPFRSSQTTVSYATKEDEDDPLDDFQDSCTGGNTIMVP